MPILTRIAKPKKKIRLDKYLYTAGITLSRTAIQKLIEQGEVLVNDSIVKSHHILKQGDKIDVLYEKKERFKVEPENIELNIIYEDEDIIVVNKPPFMVTHPAPGNLKGTLVNALLYHCNLCAESERTRPGVLHRLDKETSGLLVFAKSDIALLTLAKQVEKHKLTREYLAFVLGSINLNKLSIDAPIGRHTIERKKMAVTPLSSRSAVTHLSVIKKWKDISYINLKLETGRTHQIRVHLSHIGHPVVGDKTYEGRKSPPNMDEHRFTKIMKIAKRQALHAHKLGFIHPILNKYMEFTAPLPEDMQELLDFLNESQEIKIKKEGSRNLQVA